MRKIGISVNDNNYNLLDQIAKYNGLKTTTLCSLILLARLNYYKKSGFMPKFKNVIYEEYRKPTNEIKEKDQQESPSNPDDNRTWEELIDSICGKDEQ